MLSVPLLRTFLAAMLFMAAWSSAWAQFGSIVDQPSDILDNVQNWEGVTLPGGSVLRAEFPEDFPWDTQVSLRAGYDTNVETTKIDPISSFYTNGSIGVLYKFGSERIKFETDLTGGVTYYFSRPGKKQDYSLDFVTEAAYLTTQRLSFALNNRISYLSQPDFFIPGTDAQRVGDYWYTNTSISATFIIIPRLSSVSKWGIASITYTEPILNDASGRIDQTFSESLQYLLFPTTTAVLEARVEPTTYYESDNLDTTGYSLLTGFDHQFNPRFSWNLRVGAELRTFQNQGQEDSAINPNISSVLSYAIAERTSVAWNLIYNSETTGGFGGASIRQTFRTGLNASYGFTSRLTATLDLYYQHNHYDQPVGSGLNEDIFSGSLGLTFRINRHLTANILYQYISDNYPEIESIGYERNIIYAGLNLLF